MWMLSDRRYNNILCQHGLNDTELVLLNERLDGKDTGVVTTSWYIRVKPRPLWGEGHNIKYNLNK